MSVEGELHAALMAQVETISGFPILWPQVSADVPGSDHIRVSHVPNENSPADLNSNKMNRQGFLYLTLVSGVARHEVETRNTAGDIAAYFRRGLRLSHNTTNVTITGHSIRPGRQEGGRWETPIRISYRSIA
ncbi:MAG: hypothetical protein JXR13_18730 [Thalassovita sp.]